MKTGIRFDDKVCVVSLDGQINITTQTDIKNLVNSAIDQMTRLKKKVFILEITKGSHITSSGIKLVFDIHAQCVEADLKFGILNQSDTVKSVFKLSGLENYMVIHGDYDTLVKLVR